MGCRTIDNNNSKLSLVVTYCDGALSEETQYSDIQVIEITPKEFSA
jgi:hypothetical protein